MIAVLLVSPCLGSPLPLLPHLSPLVSLLQDEAMMTDMAGAMDAAAGGAMGAADMTAMGRNGLYCLEYISPIL